MNGPNDYETTTRGSHQATGQPEGFFMSGALMPRTGAQPSAARTSPPRPAPPSGLNRGTGTASTPVAPRVAGANRPSVSSWVAGVAAPPANPQPSNSHTAAESPPRRLNFSVRDDSFMNGPDGYQPTIRDANQIPGQPPEFFMSGALDARPRAQTAQSTQSTPSRSRAPPRPYQPPGFRREAGNTGGAAPAPTPSNRGRSGDSAAPGAGAGAGPPSGQGSVVRQNGSPAAGPSRPRQPAIADGHLFQYDLGNVRPSDSDEVRRVLPGGYACSTPSDESEESPDSLAGEPEERLQIDSGDNALRVQASMHLHLIPKPDVAPLLAKMSHAQRLRNLAAHYNLRTKGADVTIPRGQPRAALAMVFRRKIRYRHDINGTRSVWVVDNPDDWRNPSDNNYSRHRARNGKFPGSEFTSK